MILRRITEHVKAQNWFAVGIDFIIVVVGVFIGIQVSNWNESRALNNQSSLFSERLVADLKEEAWNFDFMIEYYDDVLKHAEIALSILEGRQTASDEALLVSAFRATQYNEAYRRRATFDELTSTGNMGLIRDPELRLTAVRIYTAPLFENLSAEGYNSRYREAFRMIVPVDVQEVLTNTCGDKILTIGDYDSIVDSLDYECATGLSQQALGEAATRLKSDEMLVPLLRLRIININSVMASLLSYNPEIRSGLEAIAGRAQ